MALAQQNDASRKVTTTPYGTWLLQAASVVLQTELKNEAPMLDSVLCSTITGKHASCIWQSTGTSYLNRGR